MGTVNSSRETRSRAKSLAEAIGSYHLDFDIDSAVGAVTAIVQSAVAVVARFKSQGGSTREDLALQNIQARLRMVIGYMAAQLLPVARGTSRSLIVLGSSNVEEGLRGYFTKYDCSSADFNPIGALSKSDLRLFVDWARIQFNIPMAEEYCSVSSRLLSASPTAELRPSSEERIQTDEEDMGFTYKQLQILGRLRKISKCGPFSMVGKVATALGCTVEQAAATVKSFFGYYGMNRHKMTTITPAYHAESYSPDDNRFDLRPFLYPNWQFQFRKIDEYVEVKRSQQQTNK